MADMKMGVGRCCCPPRFLYFVNRCGWITKVPYQQPPFELTLYVGSGIPGSFLTYRGTVTAIGNGLITQVANDNDSSDVFNLSQHSCPQLATVNAPYSFGQEIFSASPNYTPQYPTSESVAIHNDLWSTSSIDFSASATGNVFFPTQGDAWYSWHSMVVVGGIDAVMPIRGSGFHAGSDYLAVYFRQDASDLSYGKVHVAGIDIPYGGISGGLIKGFPTEQNGIVGVEFRNINLQLTGTITRTITNEDLRTYDSVIDVTYSATGTGENGVTQISGNRTRTRSVSFSPCSLLIGNAGARGPVATKQVTANYSAPPQTDPVCATRYRLIMGEFDGYSDTLALPTTFQMDVGNDLCGTAITGPATVLVEESLYQSGLYSLFQVTITIPTANGDIVRTQDLNEVVRTIFFQYCPFQVALFRAS